MTSKRQPSEPRRRVLTPERATKAARRAFIRTGTIDMDALASALWVSRATLYRVVGNRERLLGDVLWSLAEPTLRSAISATRSVGVDRIVDISERYTEAILAFEPFRRFVRAEPLTAFHVLFTPAGGFLERTLEAWRALIGQEVEAGTIVLPFDLDTFTYVMVRAGESMLYSDLLGGLPHYREKASAVTRALFNAPSEP